MSTGSPSDPDPDPDPDLNTESYDLMLEQLDNAIAELTEKIENGRIRDPERDKVRLKMYRTLGYLIRTKRKVLEDKTLEDLEVEVQKLKEADESITAGVGTEA